MSSLLTPAEVGNWQRFLNERSITDWEAKPLVVDEAFGSRTSYATRQWQTENGLSATGDVSTSERRIALSQGFLPFVQAKNASIIHPKTRTIDLLVIHTMENQEKPTSAENVALWFAGRTQYPAPQASAHYCIDTDSTVQCVRDMDIAWHAPGANHDGIGIEHAGYARQTPSEWFDDTSKAILERSARLTAKLAKLYEVPLVKLAPGDLSLNKRGFCGHVDVTLAFPGPGRSHSDPGPNFPWEFYLDLVAAARNT